MLLKDDTSGPQEILNRDTSNQKEPEAEILHKFGYKILIQVVQKDPHTEILRQILHKWLKRILIQVV